jgi:hypothetical protein
MSPRLPPINLSTLLCVIGMSASMAFAQSQWKEIPVGYNMPKSVMAVASLSTMAMATSPPAKAATKKYYGQERDPYHKWEVEFHGGGFFTLGSAPPGQAFLPTAGTPFLTVNGTPSLFVTSYMFGDGAVLANQVAAEGVGGPITPLDPLLGQALGRHDNGPSIGVRLSRDFGAYFNGELNVDWSVSPIAIGDSRLIQVEATRSSFTDLFPVSTPEGAISDIRRSAGSQLFYTGVVNVNLKTKGKVLPYLSFGGGAVSDLGPRPHAGIFGQFAFVPTHQETDVVNLEAGSKHSTHFVGVLGFGVKYYATSRWGLRLDVRDHVTRNYIDTILSAHPIIAMLNPGDAISFGTSPADIQFSNDPSKGASSLSGEANRLRTFKGDGIENQLNFSMGVLYRF